MKFTPTGNRILVKPDEAQDKSKGGILLPDTAKEKPRRGKIISKGAGKLLDDGTTREIAFKEGDTVMFERYGGSQIDLEGEEFLVMDADVVLGTLSVK